MRNNFSSVGLTTSVRTSLRAFPLFAPFPIRWSGFVVPTSKSADELQSTEHTKICPLLLHRVVGEACEWLPPVLDLSHTQRDTYKRVKLTDALSCALCTSRGAIPIVCQCRGSTQETNFFSDDAAAILADRCQSRRHLSSR